MSENKIKQNRYVAYFDMLGLKTATLNNPTVAWIALRSLRECIDEILNLKVVVTSKKVVLKNPIKAFILADSVLVFTYNDDFYNLSAILRLSSELFARALHKCVPLRGAITYGEFFYNFDLNLFGGVPFVRAYELERKAQWSGVVIDDVVFEHYKKWQRDMPKCGNGCFIIIPWNIPLKDNKKEHGLCLNWVTPHKRKFTAQTTISVSDYYSGFRNLFGDFEQLDKGVKAKYENTVEFINYCLQQ